MTTDAAPRGAPAAPADGASAAPPTAGRMLGVLALAAMIGFPVAVAALLVLAAVNGMQTVLWHDLPDALGRTSPPWYLVLAVPSVGGILAGLAVTRLPGGGGHVPTTPTGTAAAPQPSHLPGIILAALATLPFGAVLGPEAPLIALGGGLGLLAARLSRMSADAGRLAEAAGTFSSVSALFGSPVSGSTLLLEALGLAGPARRIVMLAGLLSAGIGYLAFTGIDGWSGFDAATLPTLSPRSTGLYARDIVSAVLLGLLGALLAVVARGIGGRVERTARRPARPVLTTAAAGLVVGLLALAGSAAPGVAATDVLFNGEQALVGLSAHTGSYAGWTLVVLIVAKTIAYGVSLGGGFRGGPIFPAIFLGGAFGALAVQVVPSLDPLTAIAAGIGGATAAMIGLPLTAVLLSTLLMGEKQIEAMPPTIVAAVVAIVATRVVESRTQARQATREHDDSR